MKKYNYENFMKEENNYFQTYTKRIEEVNKILFIIDMNEGFVNCGNMSNKEYNKLVPEQLKLINIFRNEDQPVNFILENHTKDSIELKKYPEHCINGTNETLLIPELLPEQTKPNTSTYYKNSINGMLNRNLQDNIRSLKNLKYIAIGGVCADLCVMDFTLTLLRYLDELNMNTNVIVIKSMIDTYDAPNHDREEWITIAYKVLTQAGAIIVENVEEYKKVVEQLEIKEQQNKLVRRKKYGK